MSERVKIKALSVFRKKALEVIRDNPGLTAGDFAGHMWPEALMHRRVSNQGHGACRGKAAWLCGGSHAMRLVHDGLVADRPIGGGYARGYWLTQAGREALQKGEVVSA